MPCAPRQRASVCTRTRPATTANAVRPTVRGRSTRLAAVGFVLADTATASIAKLAFPDSTHVRGCCKSFAWERGRARQKGGRAYDRLPCSLPQRTRKTVRPVYVRFAPDAGNRIELDGSLKARGGARGRRRWGCLSMICGRRHRRGPPDLLCRPDVRRETYNRRP